MTSFRCCRAWMVAGWIIGVLAVGGCSSSPKVPPSVAAGSRAESVLLSYRVEPPPAPPPSATASEGQLVSYQSPAAPETPRVAKSLSIRSPHPNGNAELALVEVTTMVPVAGSAPAAGDPRPAWRGWFDSVGDRVRDTGSNGVTYRWHEAWRMDIPRSDVDYLLAQLAAGGYYAGTAPSPPNTLIAAHVDGVYVSKPWNNVVGLDGLIEHVCRHGQLVSRSPEARLAAGSGTSAPPAWQAARPPGVIPLDEEARIRPSRMTEVQQQRTTQMAPSYVGAAGSPGTAMALRPPQPGFYSR